MLVKIVNLELIQNRSKMKLKPRIILHKEYKLQNYSVRNIPDSRPIGYAILTLKYWIRDPDPELLERDPDLEL